MKLGIAGEVAREAFLGKLADGHTESDAWEYAAAAAILYAIGTLDEERKDNDETRTNRTTKVPAGI